MNDSLGVHAALETFGRGESSFRELREQLRGLVEFDVTEGQESVRFLRGGLPDVALRVTDVRRVIEKYLAGNMSPDDVAAWATVLTLLGCFELEADAGESAAAAWDALQHFSAPSVSRAFERQNAEAWLARISLRSE